MRSTDLFETFGDFSQDAASAVNSLTSLARAAAGKLKGAKDKATNDIHQANAREKAAQDKAAAEAEKLAGKNKPKFTADNMDSVISHVVLSRTPEVLEDVEELKDIQPEQVDKVLSVIDKVKERVTKFPVALRKGLKASDFLQDNHKSDSELSDMLADQNDAAVEAVEEQFMKDSFGEHDVWESIMTDDNTAENVNAIIHLIKAISRDYEKKNLASTGTANKKNYPEGTGIVKIISIHRQLLEMRLGLLRSIVEKIDSKPVTEAVLVKLREMLRT